ncbi:hypothetical protein EDE04_0643 [Streptomyces sp. 2132.2]|uniref:hypothetical protein n=1 Tax=Streptomyces sp. 2132.2 TaxID=2485161 RepID=UPI000F4AA746|nr:hypothetical protein [Streptomyces sp. 2132.2]ROQ94230.1 hypothetical protein EDE04_0643 [Streptomyces sp. 2132.2]
MAEAEESARDLGIVCANADAIRARLTGRGPAGAAAVLEDVLAAARSGRETGDAVGTLHAVLQALGDPLGLHAYEDPVASGGTGSPTGRGVHAVGVGGERSGEPVYLCPARRCTRHGWPDHAPAPLCAVSGGRLRLDRL